MDGDNETLSIVSTPLASASLLDINRRHTAAVPGPGGIWSVFHAGVIGRGLKPPKIVQSRNHQEVIYNTQSLVSLLVHCCSASGNSEREGCWGAPTLSPEAAKAVAVTLVESVCPNAAGAELAWPPEDHARATMERDLRIGRRFQEQPLLFELLKLVAAAPPALCYCSVLLQGLMVALLSRWETSQHPDTTHSPWHLEASLSWWLSWLREASCHQPWVICTRYLANWHLLKCVCCCLVSGVFFGSMGPCPRSSSSSLNVAASSGTLPGRVELKEDHICLCCTVSSTATSIAWGSSLAAFKHLRHPLCFGRGLDLFSTSCARLN